jgi:uncharacterized membrane protein YkoI
MRYGIAVMAALMVGCGSATASNAGHSQELELIKTSKIEVTDAIKSAQTKTPGRVIDTELRSKNGRTVWEVDVATADGKAAEVDVDAQTGQVLDSE